MNQICEDAQTSGSPVLYTGSLDVFQSGGEYSHDLLEVSDEEPAFNPIMDRRKIEGVVRKEIKEEKIQQKLEDHGGIHHYRPNDNKRVEIKEEPKERNSRPRVEEDKYQDFEEEKKPRESISGRSYFNYIKNDIKIN